MSDIEHEIMAATPQANCPLLEEVQNLMKQGFKGKLIQGSGALPEYVIATKGDRFEIQPFLGDPGRFAIFKVHNGIQVECDDFSHGRITQRYTYPGPNQTHIDNFNAKGVLDGTEDFTLTIGGSTEKFWNNRDGHVHRGVIRREPRHSIWT